MQKKYFIIISFIFNVILLQGQTSSANVPISITYSENEIFSLKSISYDNEYSTLRGKSIIYKNGQEFYSINRSFDLYNSAKFRLVLSNDGSTVIYFTDHSNYDGDEFKNVTIYKNGVLIDSFDSHEFVKCDYKKEKCGLFYKTTEWEIQKNIKDYPDNEININKERFLIDNYLLVNDGIIYLIDKRKIVIKYSIDELKFIEKEDFNIIYEKLKKLKSPKSIIEYYDYYTKSHKYLSDIEELNSTNTLSSGIAKLFKLKYVDSNNKTYRKYSLYKFDLSGYIKRGGGFEIEKLDCDTAVFNKKKILNYLNNTIFKTDSLIPKQVDKLYKESFFGGFRHKNLIKAKKVTRLKKEKRIEDYKKRLKLDTIDGLYIPKNLLETNIKLDERLNFESKQDILKVEHSWMLNSHLGGLGMWIRNNWGINGGSRLANYFYKRGIYNRDNISGIIIDEYIAWLKEDKNSWERWEKSNPEKK